MQRAISKDPDFQSGCIIPLLLKPCTLPVEIQKKNSLQNPLWIDFSGDYDEQANAWRKLADACQLDLGPMVGDNSNDKADITVNVNQWLRAYQATTNYLKRCDSVCLRARNINSQSLLHAIRQHLKQQGHSVGAVDLANPNTLNRRGLIQAMFKAWGLQPIIDDNPNNDLLQLSQVLKQHKTTTGKAYYLLLEHFELVATGSREKDYSHDFFVSLRYHLMQAKNLVLIVQAKTHFAQLLPADNVLSEIDIKTVEL